MSRKFFKADNVIYLVSSITEINLEEIEDLKVTVAVRGFYNKHVVVEGVDAINFVMQVCPHALEGKKLRWIKYGWALHNFVGHPLMQFLCFFKCYGLAFKVHDWTIPKPRGIKKVDHTKGKRSVSGHLKLLYKEGSGVCFAFIKYDDFYDNDDDRVHLLEDGDFISAMKEDEVVWEHLVDKDTPRRTFDRTDMGKYDRLDFDNAFRDELRATLYVKDEK